MKLNLFDGLRSLIGNLGNPNRDKAASVYFSDVVIDDSQLIAAYGSNWIARKLIEIPAKDALRKWRTWDSDDKHTIEAEEKRLKIKSKMMEAYIKARLFGGAAIYIGTGDEPDTPLEPSSIKRGGIEYLTVMSRREVTTGQIVYDPQNELYGKPEDYKISGAGIYATVHPSRLILLNGPEKADIWIDSGVNAGWGDSALKSTADAIKQGGGAFANVSSLIFEANVDVIGVPGLMDKMGSQDYENKLLKRFSLASAGKGVNGTLILDSKEEYNRRSTSFANMPDLLDKFAMQCAAAADIPGTRFLSQSPAGLNSTGDGDMKNYHDRISSDQTLIIEPSMSNFDQCLIYSALGAAPADLSYKWNPLKLRDEKEDADNGKTSVESLKGINDLDVFTPEEMRLIAIRLLSETAAFSHVREVIEEAEASSDVD